MPPSDDLAPKRRRPRNALAVALALACTVAGRADSATKVAPESPVFTALDAELSRTVDAYRGRPDAPYYLAYRVTDVHDVHIEARYGAALPVADSRTRDLDVSARVGSRQIDNTHRMREKRNFSFGHQDSLSLPVDGSMSALRAGIWEATAEAIRQAQRAFLQVQANRQIKVAETDPSPDFSEDRPSVSVGTEGDVNIDAGAWLDALRPLSERLDRDPRIEDSSATLDAQSENAWFIDSEGSRILQSRLWYRVALHAVATADDGGKAEIYRWKDVAEPSRLPSPAELFGWADALVHDVVALRAAPLADAYSGPVLLSGAAAGVFIHEVIGHRVEAERQKSENEGQTFRDKVGEALLPDFIDIYDDPTLRSYAGLDLNGHYDYDTEGQPASRASIVDHGVFRGFILGRSPVAGFPRSNGHGRAAVGHAPQARMANTIVETRKPTPAASLRAMLQQEVKAQGRPFGVIVQDLSGGFTMTGRVTPNAFNIRADTVWRVYADGRPDELVRGVDLVGTPLVALSHIVATGDDVAVFNGFCGAESGHVPNAAVSPSLLISQLEMQKKERDQQKPILLPKPTINGFASVR